MPAISLDSPLRLVDGVQLQREIRSCVDWLLRLQCSWCRQL